MDRFPSLFALAANGDARVSDYLEQFPSLVVWSSDFVRPSFWEDDSVIHFFAMLDKASPRASLLDTVRWSLNSTGKFPVKSYFLHLSFPLDNASSLFQIPICHGILSGSLGPL